MLIFYFRYLCSLDRQLSDDRGLVYLVTDRTLPRIYVQTIYLRSVTRHTHVVSFRALLTYVLTPDRTSLSSPFRRKSFPTTYVHTRLSHFTLSHPISLALTTSPSRVPWNLLPFLQVNSSLRPSVYPPSPLSYPVQCYSQPPMVIFVLS